VRTMLGDRLMPQINPSFNLQALLLVSGMVIGWFARMTQKVVSFVCLSRSMRRSYLKIHGVSR
jgi:hypothetical protein